jgi:hypothetical protein
LQLIRIDAGMLPNPPIGFIDIGSVADAKMPNDSGNVSANPKQSVVAGPENSPPAASKNVVPMSVDGIRGRSQILEVAQSTHRESMSNITVHLEIYSERQAFDPNMANARLSNAAIENDVSAKPAGFVNSTENRREASLEKLNCEQTAWVNNAVAEKAAANAFFTVEAETQAVFMQPASDSGGKEIIRSIANRQKYDAPATPESACEAAAFSTPSARHESDEQLHLQGVFAESEKNSAESKPLPIASEEKHRTQLIDLAIAAVAGQFAVPGWRQFFSKSKTHCIPPRRRDSTK